MEWTEGVGAAAAARRITAKERKITRLVYVTFEFYSTNVRPAERAARRNLASSVASGSASRKASSR